MIAKLITRFLSLLQPAMTLLVLVVCVLTFVVSLGSHVDQRLGGVKPCCTPGTVSSQRHSFNDLFHHTQTPHQLASLNRAVRGDLTGDL